ncbi:MAG: hypothetical protein IPH84_15960 [Bacteroidales bacterium]|nr:hypothetical protein [Bacteroidales bacterium]
MKSPVIKVVLALVIVILGYLVYNSINTPLKFEQELQSRSEDVISKLKDIRTAQSLFKTLNKRYTTSFDTLIQFVREGKVPEVKMVPDPKDTTNTRTITDTIGFVSIFDSIFAKKNYKLEELELIPFSNNEKFTLQAGKINKGGVDVSVFEVTAPLETYSIGLNKQLVINRVQEMKDKNKFPGLKVGSMYEASTDGNWE